MIARVALLITTADMLDLTFAGLCNDSQGQQGQDSAGGGLHLAVRDGLRSDV